MNSTEIVSALTRERELLEDFICLSEEQLLLLADEDLDGFDTLLQRRADLMIELTAIEGTLGTWITQIRTDPTVTPDMMDDLRAINDEIVRMANHIVEIDEEAHARLDRIKQKTHSQIRGIETPRNTPRTYSTGCASSPRTDL